jgi:Ricin-type beta-trefoil lectin domain-like/Pectate lyase superfamily protein
MKLFLCATLLLVHFGFVATCCAQSNASSFITTIVAESSSSCLDIDDGSSRVGLGLDQWTCGGTSNQSFRFRAVTGGYYIIQPQNDNLCLDAGSGSQTTGIQIVQNTCSSSSTQQWKLNANSDGSFTITTINGAGCFDVFDGSTANGAIVETYACHGTSNESFVISGFHSTSVPTPAAQTPPSGPSTPSLPSSPSTPTVSANPSAPNIFNVSANAHAGDIVSIQGTNFDSTSQVWLGGTNRSSATQLPMINRWGAEWIGAQIPQSWTGAMILWVTNSAGASNSLKLNGPTPFNLDAMELLPGGAFRVLGRNLLMPGYTPSVTVDGQAATINLSASTENLLVVTAPESISPASNATIMVDNGVGIGAAQLDRTIAVVSGSGDPFSLGIGWGAEFAFYGRTVTVNTPCNGSQDDSMNIQSAINSVPSSGGVVVLPAGNCVLANTLTMKSNLVLQGAGKDVTVLSYKSNYPIYAENFNLVGLRNFSLVNVNSTVEGLIWKNNTRSFFENIKVETGVSHQLYLTGNQNFIVIGSDFIQGGSVGSQNPYLFTDCTGFVFSGNTSTSVDGSPTFQSVHDALILNNHFTRNAVNQYESVIIATHQFVMDFAFRIAIIGNTFDVINGPITNTLRNDGETLLTEGGGGQRTENLGTVGSATSNTITDPNNTINVNPFGNGLPENYGIAIVNGTGAGQTREVIGYSNNTMQVDHPWNVVPDSTSRYATFVWGLEKAVIENNTLIDNPRGIWLYQTAVRDVDISWNTITNGGGIYVRTWESQPNSQFDADYNLRISNNKISNSDGIWMSYINAVFVNSDQLDFGTADTGIEIRNNILTANNPNVTSSTEDYANREGFMNGMRSEGSGGQLTGTPMLLGTIFQTNQCGNCSTAFVIGTGDYGTILSNNQPSPSSPNFLADWQILGSGNPGSIGTVIQ